MKTIFFTLLLLTLSQFVYASPFNSQVAGITVGNAHILSVNDENQPLVIRGKAPTNRQIEELVEIGVERVLIFKNKTKDEVASEIATLKENGFQSANIIHIPFLWKDITDFKSACDMTVQALQVLEESEVANQTIFFHCTVGEDRTGYLAGLFQIWKDADAEVASVFQNEMCSRGYEAGNKWKPVHVVSKIRESLTPTFEKMAVLLKQQQRAGKSLGDILCPSDIRLKTKDKYICKTH